MLKLHRYGFALLLATTASMVAAAEEKKEQKPVGMPSSQPHPLITSLRATTNVNLVPSPTHQATGTPTNECQMDSMVHALTFTPASANPCEVCPVNHTQRDNPIMTRMVRLQLQPGVSSFDEPGHVDISTRFVNKKILYLK